MVSRSESRSAIDPRFLWNGDPVEMEEGFQDMPTVDKGLANQPESTGGVWKTFLIVGLVLLYYVISMSISAFNTQILSKNRYNFPYPLFAALIYGIIQFVLAFSIMALWTLRHPGTGPINAFRRLGWPKFSKTIVPCAAAAALDISLSNCSLKHVSLSFYTMIKSSSPVFVLLFAFLLRLEKPSWTVGGIIAIIGFGTLLTVWNPTGFDMLGFGLVFSAAVMGGARWALTQLIIEKQVGKSAALSADDEEMEEREEASGPLSAILFLTPPIALTMAVLCQIFEGFPQIFASHLFASSEMVLTTAGICLSGGLLTFTLILTEYKVVELTSVITFSIAGIFKELGMIALSVLIFGDHLLAINYVGLAISITGIAAYNIHKIRKRRQAATSRVGRFGSRLPAAPSDFYLAVPTVETVPKETGLPNPFQDDDDYFYELKDMQWPHSVADFRHCPYSLTGSPVVHDMRPQTTTSSPVHGGGVVPSDYNDFSVVHPDGSNRRASDHHPFKSAQMHLPDLPVQEDPVTNRLHTSQKEGFQR